MKTRAFARVFAYVFAVLFATLAGAQAAWAFDLFRSMTQSLNGNPAQADGRVPANQTTGIRGPHHQKWDADPQVGDIPDSYLLKDYIAEARMQVIRRTMLQHSSDTMTSTLAQGREGAAGMDMGQLMGLAQQVVAVQNKAAANGGLPPLEDMPPSPWFERRALALRAQNPAKPRVAGNPYCLPANFDETQLRTALHTLVKAKTLQDPDTLLLSEALDIALWEQYPCKNAARTHPRIEAAKYRAAAVSAGLKAEAAQREAQRAAEAEASKKTFEKTPESAAPVDTGKAEAVTAEAAMAE